MTLVIELNDESTEEYGVPSTTTLVLSLSCMLNRERELLDSYQ
jgi:hypothetical protein